MKRQSLFIGILAVFVWGLLSACAATTEAVQNTEPSMASLDTAIQAAVKNISGNLAEGTKIVVLNFNSPSDQFTDYVIEEISLSLVNAKKLTVVERKNLDLIREEKNFQLSGEVSDESAQEIGKLLGAQSIVSGSLINMGDSYRFRVKTINVATAAIETSYSVSVSDSGQVKYLLASGKSAPDTGTRIAGKGEAGAPQVQVQIVPQIPFASLTPEFQAVALDPPAARRAGPAEPPAEKVYQIGDTGPAGGLIFYDKGRYSEGWRYLEAAPATTETTAQWRFKSGALGADIPFSTLVNSKEVGTGQTNTQDIMMYFSQNGGGFGLAVQVCDELVLNGFEDWFLPSLDELSYMYGNLYRRGLGGFRNDWYYSSTINGYSASRMNFANGEPEDGDTAVSRRVRAVRRF
jgi:TolB-like protein